MREKNSEHIVLHIDLAYLVKTNNNNIAISGLVPRPDNINNKTKEFNESLKKMCSVLAYSL